MKRVLKSFFYSFPVQLVLLHFKKFQVLILFWLILFSAVNGSFMKMYGVDSLYLAPEYLDNVNFLSTLFVGAATGIFIMSWNITTFILFSRHFKFLATNTKPFLKYCINNAVIPLIFLFCYFFAAVNHGRSKELLSVSDILLLVAGFLTGLVCSVSVSFYYFFRADKTINRYVLPASEHQPRLPLQQAHIVLNSGGSRLLKIQSYFDSPFSIKAVRGVAHYNNAFVEKVFSRHHFAAVISIFIAFLFLIILGFFLDRPIFQLPAAASITLLFAVLVSVAGAFSYFLQSWSVPFLVLLIILLNVLYRYEVIDPTNKAYGLDYENRKERPAYNREALLQLCSSEQVEKDYDSMVQVLKNWKRKQTEAKPVLYLVATSGGGTRSAAFTMNVLQQLDSVSSGRFMDKVFMITGASGGILGAAYFRELAKLKGTGVSINLQDKRYIDNISKDLLNPVLSSLVARDLTSPSQKFHAGEHDYVKDRGYAFEQKLAENTQWLLNKPLNDLAEDERKAVMPLMIFNSVITRDSRRMLISTQPVSFLMRPACDTQRVGDIEPDAVDFCALFARQQPMNLRLLSALRMNATFPYILPNVWLPSNPVIDVMDAGLRDNFGQETALRFLFVFRKWIEENTSKVVLIQIRDRRNGGWDDPFETNNISELITKPMLLFQYNYYKMQEYSQNEVIGMQSILNDRFYKLSFQYVPKKEDAAAALNFHLTRREKQDIEGALSNEDNKSSFKKFKSFLPENSMKENKVN